MPFFFVFYFFFNFIFLVPPPPPFWKKFTFRFFSFWTFPYTMMKKVFPVICYIFIILLLLFAYLESCYLSLLFIPTV